MSERQTEKEFMKGKAGWTAKQWRSYGYKLQNDIKCRESTLRILAKMLSGYLMQDADASKLKMTETEREMIENSRQVAQAIFEWI